MFLRNGEPTELEIGDEIIYYPNNAGRTGYGSFEIRRDGDKLLWDRRRSYEKPAPVFKDAEQFRSLCPVILSLVGIEAPYSFSNNGKPKEDSHFCIICTIGG